MRRTKKSLTEIKAKTAERLLESLFIHFVGPSYAYIFYGHICMNEGSPKIVRVGHTCGTLRERAVTIVIVYEKKRS